MPFVNLSEFPTFGRVATWDEWRTATSQALPDMLFPWFVSNMSGFLLLWIAIKFPWFSRQSWGLLMMLACVVNCYEMVLTDPTGYHEFGVLAIPPLQRFIYSKYFANPAFMVLPIAAGQMAIGLALLLCGEKPSRRRLLKAGLTGAIVWFFGIAPLGLASAFPSSLVFASTMMLCWPRTLHKNKKS